MVTDDPFQVLKQAVLAEDPTFRAPAEAVASWRELAERARDELIRMGFPAAVVSGEMPFGNPHGAQVQVHAMHPFGVTLAWDPPLTETDEYQEAATPGPTASPLLEYVVTSEEIITRALLDVLRLAGFRVLVDHEERQTFNYRVLDAPVHPLV